ncbi:MAG: hypothetical protein SNJ71_02390, partial [Bacteroidales bacterium]
MVFGIVIPIQVYKASSNRLAIKCTLFIIIKDKNGKISVYEKLVDFGIKGSLGYYITPEFKTINP